MQARDTPNNGSAERLLVIPNGFGEPRVESASEDLSQIFQLCDCEEHNRSRHDSATMYRTRYL
jgi:hypothetical protein